MAATTSDPLIPSISSWLIPRPQLSETPLFLVRSPVPPQGIRSWIRSRKPTNQRLGRHQVLHRPKLDFVCGESRIWPDFTQPSLILTNELPWRTSLRTLTSLKPCSNY